MRICILDGHGPSGSSDYAPWIDALMAALKENGHEAVCIGLAEQSIKSCRGCWDCWVKTPGRCTIEDDMHDILPEVINADWLVLISPMIMGFPSATLKMCMDRMVPLVNPYIEIEGSECHHVKRYEKSPKLGLVLHRGDDTDVEDIDIVSDIFGRFARNMKSKLSFVRLTSQSAEEVCHGLDRL